MATTDTDRLRSFCLKAGEALLMKKGEAKRVAMNAIRRESRDLSKVERQAVLDFFHRSFKDGDISDNKIVFAIKGILGTGPALLWLYQAVSNWAIPEKRAMKLGAGISSPWEAKKRIKLSLVLKREKERQLALRREIDLKLAGYNLTEDEAQRAREEFDFEDARITDGLKFWFSHLKTLKKNGFFSEILEAFSTISELRRQIHSLKIEIASRDKEIKAMKDEVREQEDLVLEELWELQNRIVLLQDEKAPLRVQLDRLEESLKKEESRMLSAELLLEIRVGQALDEIVLLSRQADFLERSLGEAPCVIPSISIRSVDHETKVILARRLYEDAEEEPRKEEADFLIELADNLLRRA
jgi:hypothetical protein